LLLASVYFLLSGLCSLHFKASYVLSDLLSI
jgi:hypothetical protein